MVFALPSAGRTGPSRLQGPARGRMRTISSGWRRSAEYELPPGSSIIRRSICVGPMDGRWPIVSMPPRADQGRRRWVAVAVPCRHRQFSRPSRRSDEGHRMLHVLGRFLHLQLVQSSKTKGGSSSSSPFGVWINPSRPELSKSTGQGPGRRLGPQ